MCRAYLYIKHVSNTEASVINSEMHSYKVTDYVYLYAGNKSSIAIVLHRIPFIIIVFSLAPGRLCGGYHTFTFLNIS